LAELLNDMKIAEEAPDADENEGFVDEFIKKLDNIKIEKWWGARLATWDGKF